MGLKPPTADAMPDQAEKPTAYRTLGAMGGGVLLGVFGLFGAVAFSVGSEKHYLASAVALALAVAGLIGGLYPVTLSYADRIVVRNPFRTIVAAWPRVRSVEAGLSLVLTTEPQGEGSEAVPERKFTIWSIPVSLRQRRKMDRVQAKSIRDTRMEAMRSARAANDADSLAHGGGRHMGSGFGTKDPIEMMAFADQAVQEMRDRKQYCKTSLKDAAPTTARWNPWTLGSSAVCVLLLVLAATGVF